MSRVDSSKKKEAMLNNNKNTKKIYPEEINYQYEKINFSRPKSSGKKQFSGKKGEIKTHNKEK